MEATVIGLVRRQVMEYLYLFAVWYRDAMVLEAGGPDEAVLNRDRVFRDLFFKLGPTTTPAR